MKNLSLAAVAALSLAIVSPTLAADETPAPHANHAAEAAGTEGEAKVCRKVPVTGSRVQAKKVCATPSEWREMGYAMDETKAEKGKGSR